MIIQNRDGSLVWEPGDPGRCDNKIESCYAELPAALLDEQSNLIERIISFAFDNMGVRHLRVRVRDAE